MKELGKRIFYGLPYKVFLVVAMIIGLIVVFGHILKNLYLDLKDNL